MEKRFLDACKLNIPMELHLLRAHLYAEELLTKILIDNIPRPKKLDLERMGFRRKLQITSAFELIPEDLSNGLNQLNKLRNKLAHTFRREVYLDDVEKLMNSMGGEVKNHIEELVNSNLKQSTKDIPEEYFGNLFIATVAFIAGQLSSIAEVE
ncbi:MAG: hypothetical protein ABIE92_02155 [bacterium]